MRVLIPILFPALLLAGWIPFTSPDQAAVQTRLISDFDGTTIVEFEIPGYNLEPVIINGKPFVRIGLPQNPNYLIAGMPDLPMVNRAIIIPDNAHMALEIIEAETEIVKTKPVAPSKGNLPRTVDPQLVPYRLGDFYKKDAWFPEKRVELKEPFILRDYRGVSIGYNPFQYNPRTRELKITKRLRVRVYQDGSGQVNVKTRPRAPGRGFRPIYENTFLNFKERSRWDTIDEHAG